MLVVISPRFERAVRFSAVIEEAEEHIPLMSFNYDRKQLGVGFWVYFLAEIPEKIIISGNNDAPEQSLIEIVHLHAAVCDKLVHILDSFKASGRVILTVTKLSFCERDFDSDV